MDEFVRIKEKVDEAFRYVKSVEDISDETLERLDKFYGKLCKLADFIEKVEDVKERMEIFEHVFTQETLGKIIKAVKELDPILKLIEDKYD